MTGELDEALADGDLILCVGPGPSLAAGLPDLEALATSMLDHAASGDRTLDAASMRGWVGDRAVDVLEQLHHQLGAEFQREVERRLSDQGRAVPPVLETLISLRPRLRAIYTTRLDRLIERALGGRWPSFSTARPGLAQRRKLVFKMRGTLEFNQTWVLTREAQEREFGPGAPRRRVFETAFGAHRMLFVGFDVPSQELRWLLDAMPTHTAGDGPSHLIVAPQVSDAERDQLERRGLQVINPDHLAAVVRADTVEGGDAHRPAASDACPYPGLEAFSEARAPVFFGRHAEVSEATALLGTLGEVERRWLSIEGPSGVGKSSFALAGVVPALRNGFAEGTPQRWKVARLRPGTTPLANLVSALDDAFGLEDTAAASAQLTRDPRALVELTRNRLPPSEGLLVLIDQLEEIVTIAPEAEREAFGAAIARALEARIIYLVTTTRSDLIPALQRGLPSLADRLNDAAERYALPPISRAGLREAICEPAQRLGVRVEPALVERLLVDAGERVTTTLESETRTADATLPLVAHVLRGLWTPEYVADGVLTLDEYTQLGGISGALSRGADEVLASLTPDERDQAERLLLALVRPHPEGLATRRVLSLAESRELADDHVLTLMSGGAANAGTNARLLVVRDNHGHHEVELVHEALIRDWGTLRDWIHTKRDELLLGEDLARQADKWDARGRPLGELPVGRDATELLSVAPRGHGRELQSEFQAALRRVKTRRHRAVASGAAALGVGAVAVFLTRLPSGGAVDAAGSEIVTESGTTSTGGEAETGERTGEGLDVPKDLGSMTIETALAELEQEIHECLEENDPDGVAVSFRFEIEGDTGKANVTWLDNLAGVESRSRFGQCALDAANKATFEKRDEPRTFVHTFDLNPTPGMAAPAIVSVSWRAHEKASAKKKCDEPFTGEGTPDKGVLVVQWHGDSEPDGKGWGTGALVRDANGEKLDACKTNDTDHFRIKLLLGEIETSHVTVELRFSDGEGIRDLSPLTTRTIPLRALLQPQKPKLSRDDSGSDPEPRILVQMARVEGATEYKLSLRVDTREVNPERDEQHSDDHWQVYIYESELRRGTKLQAKFRVLNEHARSPWSDWGTLD